MYSNLYEKDKLLLQKIMWEQDEAITHIKHHMSSMPHIKHHMSSMPQKFHFIWSPTPVVMKKTNATSIENLDAQIYFYG
jgi:hypothetical protein